jgi:hypothetical protein
MSGAKDEVHQERQLGQSEAQMCVVRGAQRVMMKLPKRRMRMRRRVWEKRLAEAWRQEQAQREQRAVPQQLVRATRVKEGVWFGPERAMCRHQRAERWWRLRDQRC